MLTQIYYNIYITKGDAFILHLRGFAFGVLLTIWAQIVRSIVSSFLEFLSKFVELDYKMGSNIASVVAVTVIILWLLKRKILRPTLLVALFYLFFFLSLTILKDSGYFEELKEFIESVKIYLNK